MPKEEMTIKLDKKLANKVKQIAEKKFELRSIKFYSDAVREALIEFIETNKDYLETNSKKKPNPKSKKKIPA